ncbi:hypothetical protein QTP86_002540 [Hemibagrus guttatus]|nr:hypothetical protein QTP86_002540 [Hemibagrus guttatus]
MVQRLMDIVLRTYRTFAAAYLDDVLIHSSTCLPFTLHTDVSKTGLEAVLSQVFEAKEHPVFYTLRKLTPTEKNYAAVKREALAIKWAIKEMCYYLAGRHFTLVTNHAPLQWMAKAKYANARVIQWFLLLQDFSFQVQQRAESQHGNADGLSRTHTLWVQRSLGRGSELRGGGACDDTAHTDTRMWKRTTLRPLPLSSKHKQRRLSTLDSSTSVARKRISTTASAAKLECRAEREQHELKPDHSGTAKTLPCSWSFASRLLSPPAFANCLLPPPALSGLGHARLAVEMTEAGLRCTSHGPGRLAVINGTMNSAVYQKILKETVRPSVCDLKLKRTWVLQQDNDPKHSSKSTSEWLKKNKMKTLEWPSQSPDLNLIEMLWPDLKKVVHARKPSNVAELQQFCKDEWAKIPPQRCNRLIASY